MILPAIPSMTKSIIKAKLTNKNREELNEHIESEEFELFSNDLLLRVQMY